VSPYVVEVVRDGREWAVVVTVTVDCWLGSAGRRLGREFRYKRDALVFQEALQSTYGESFLDGLHPWRSS